MSERVSNRAPWQVLGHDTWEHSGHPRFQRGMETLLRHDGNYILLLVIFHIGELHFIRKTAETVFRVQQ
jgi:hypothetical protein